jgi:hypothetical protein
LSTEQNWKNEEEARWNCIENPTYSSEKGRDYVLVANELSRYIDMFTVPR